MAQLSAVVFLLSNQPSLWAWLAPVLAFCGSVLLFGGSMFGVWWTNRAASHRAIQERENERERDFRLWQRDQLLRIGDEVIQAGVGAHAECMKIRRASDPPSDESFKSIYLFAEKVTANEDRLHLIGAHDTSQCCVELREAINNLELVNTITELHRLESSGTDITTPLDDKAAESQTRQQELADKFDDLRANIKDFCQSVRNAVEAELSHTNQPGTLAPKAPYRKPISPLGVSPRGQQ